MSGFIKITSDDIRLMSSMRHATALVWMRLMLYGGKNGKAWPKQSALCEELNLSKAAVARAYKDLKEKSLLTIIERRPHSMCIKVSRVIQNEDSKQGRVIQNDTAELSQSDTQSYHNVEHRVIQNDTSIVIDKLTDNVKYKVIGANKEKTEDNRSKNICNEGVNKFTFTAEQHLWVYEFLKKWKTKQWVCKSLKQDIMDICSDRPAISVQKAIHKMDVWISKQKSADVWSGRVWYKRMQLWIKDEPEIITERDRYRMRGSTIKIDSPKQNKQEVAAAEPKKDLELNTVARRIWSGFLKIASYEDRYLAVQSWIDSGNLDEALRKQIQSDKELEDFTFMIG